MICLKNVPPLLFFHHSGKEKMDLSNVYTVVEHQYDSINEHDVGRTNLHRAEGGSLPIPQKKLREQRNPIISGKQFF